MTTATAPARPERASSTSAPRTGRELLEFCNSPSGGTSVERWMTAAGRAMGFPRRFLDWTPDQVAHVFTAWVNSESGGVLETPLPASPPAPRERPSSPIPRPPLWGETKTFAEADVLRIAQACRKTSLNALLEFASQTLAAEPSLAQCTYESVIQTLIKAASLGIDLNPTLGEGILSPRWHGPSGAHHATFMLGYRGMLRIALEAGARYIFAQVVRSKDHFEWTWGPEVQMAHRPSAESERGHIVWCYGVARLPGGELIGELLSAAEINAYRDRNQKWSSGPWKTDWAAMAKKTLVRRLFSWLPHIPPAVLDQLAAEDRLAPGEIRP